jgi:hypothetical protein
MTDDEFDAMHLKIFSEKNGLFQMLIPINWQYKNPHFYENEKHPHAFSLYENDKGAFQLSCKEVTPHIFNVIVENELDVRSR